MITVWIDELTPCLMDLTTGELVKTEVVQVVRRSFLEKYDVQSGWYTSWVTLLDQGFEIYALVVKGTVDIQGLIALQYEQESRSVFVDWMCVNPASNPQRTDNKRYSGIGGHLFAVAVDKSFAYGCEGEFYGFAANQDLVKHYQEKFGATFIGLMHPFHFAVGREAAQAIRGEYTYEWTNATL